MELGFVFPVTTAKDGFIPSKIQKKTVHNLSCVSSFPRLSPLVWVVLNIVDVLSIFFLYKIVISGRLTNYLVVFSFFNSVFSFFNSIFS